MGKVAWGFTSSIDGFIAGRDGYDAAKAQQDERDEMTSEAYGGAWSGTEIILTHRPEELADDPSVVPMNCDIREAIRRAQEIAGDRDVQIISADIARQALEHDLVQIHDESPRTFGRTYRPRGRRHAG